MGGGADDDATEGDDSLVDNGVIVHLTAAAAEAEATAEAEPGKPEGNGSVEGEPGRRGEGENAAPGKGRSSDISRGRGGPMDSPRLLASPPGNAAAGAGKVPSSSAALSASGLSRGWAVLLASPWYMRLSLIWALVCATTNGSQVWNP